MSVGRLCQLFGVSRQAFHQREHYTQHAHGQSMLVLDLVVALRKEIPGLGTRKLSLLLQEPFAQSGIRMGRDKLHSLLQTHGLTLRCKRSAPKTTNLSAWPAEVSQPASRPVDHGAPASVGLRHYYLCIGLGFGYLSLITDAYSKLIVGLLPASVADQ
ncbi:MAG: hypothetical protein WKG07_11505 [Hymenobacter sp.]